MTEFKPTALDVARGEALIEISVQLKADSEEIMAHLPENTETAALMRGLMLAARRVNESMQAVATGKPVERCTTPAALMSDGERERVANVEKRMEW